RRGALVGLSVGDIGDGHDEGGDHPVVREPDGSYLADARASLEDVVALVGPEFDVGDATEEVDTLGGYLTTRIGRLPVRGELVPGPGPFEVEVLDADPRRVKRVKIHRSRKSAGSAARAGRTAAPRPAPTPTASASASESATAATEPDKPPNET